MVEDASPAVFTQHLELLRLFLEHREEIAGKIEAVLNAQRTPSPYIQGLALFRQFEDCFFRNPAVHADQAALRGQLEQAYIAAGFQPRQVPYLHNDLTHPLEMLMRGVHCWQQTRWPGRGDRMQYAQALFNVYVLRSLEFLSLRLWDRDTQHASERLAEVQSVLDELWSGSPAHQPALVRDARWLIPLAQSLVTDALAPYLEVAQHVTDHLPEADSLEVQKAHVRMLGGHLVSQIRAYCTRDSLALNDPSVVLRTRSSNALDLALLVQGLVALLRAYETAISNGDESIRREMAGAILQGISPDPELFVHRIDLLRAYTMLENEFIAFDPAGQASYTPAAERHLRLFDEYATRMKQAIEPLREDVARFRPVNGSYSSYGVLFGLPTSLLEHMVLKAIQRDAETRFSFEDIFDADPNPDKLAWVEGWRKLPHVPREVQQSYAYPQEFAEEIFDRMERELHSTAKHASGRLCLGPDSGNLGKYLASGDPPQLLRDRQEGHFLVSWETPGGWVALKKELLTEVLGAGETARLEIPSPASQVLRLICRELVDGVSG